MAKNHYLKKLHVKIALAASSLPSLSFQPGDAELFPWKGTAPARAGMLLPAGLMLVMGRVPSQATAALPACQVRGAKNQSGTACGKGKGWQQ